MKVEQVYTKCLAQGSYYIESKGEAAVIDPLRETDVYIEMAQQRGVKIKYVFETHFHADFVSGHLTLAKQTGASIVFGPTAQPAFDCLVAKDNQEFKIGAMTITVLHTPGHTMESSSYLLKDKVGKDKALFSGDTLFLGDVGRPDLAQKAASMTQDELAGILYDSLRTRIMTLSDDVIVYPGHGAGSACGKNMSKETIGTIGNEKATNYALRVDMSKEEFVKEVIKGLEIPPAYFPDNVRLNKHGYEDVAQLIVRGNKGLSVAEFDVVSKEKHTIILDVRSTTDFVKGFIPNSIFIGIDGGFAPWVGALLKDVNTPIVLVCDVDRIEETINRLSRVGFDNVLGYLEGGITAWEVAGKNLTTIASISVNKFAALYANDSSINIVDVRKEIEYISEHIIDANLAPLSQLEMCNSVLSAEKDNFLHCAGGYRSVIACSILKKLGIHNLVNIEGGFEAIKDTAILTTEYVCPSTL